MNKTIHGIVHGKTIELDEELELPMPRGRGIGQDCASKGQMGRSDPSFGRSCTTLTTCGVCTQSWDAETWGLRVSKSNI